MDQSERMHRFGRALRSARTKAKLSQAPFAQAIGISQTALSAWERGAAMPDPDLVFEAERRLGIAPGGLSGYLGFIPFDSSTLPEPDTEFTEYLHLGGTIEPTSVVYPPSVTVLDPEQVEKLEATFAPLRQIAEQMAEANRRVEEVMRPTVQAVEAIDKVLRGIEPSASIQAAQRALEQVQAQTAQIEAVRQLAEVPLARGPKVPTSGLYEVVRPKKGGKTIRSTKPADKTKTD